MSDLNDLLETIGSIPASDEIFALVEDAVNATVYPDLGRAFWIQAWVTVALFFLVFLSVAIGLLIRYQRGRLRWTLSDGAVTRLDFKIVVPCLWAIYSIFCATVVIVLHRDMYTRTYSQLFGRLIISIHIPLIAAYILISGNVIASAPSIRSKLISLNLRYSANRTLPSVVVFNTISMGIIVAFACGVVPAVLESGDAFVRLRDAYRAALAIIKSARVAGDASALAKLAGPMAELEAGSLDNVRAGNLCGTIYSVYIFISLVSGVIPALYLNSAIRRRIAKLEGNDAGTTEIPSLPMHAASLAGPALPDSPPAFEAMDVPLGFKPELPKDRPFGNTVVCDTTPVPSRFQRIIADSSSDPATKAARLRAVLKQDSRMMACYMILLLAFAAFTLFYAARQPATLTTAQDLKMSIAFAAWNVLVPALIMSGLFLQDAFSTRRSEEEQDVQQAYALHSQATQTLPFKRDRSFSSPKLYNIHIRQSIDVATDVAIVLDHEGKKGLKSMHDVEELKA